MVMAGNEKTDPSPGGLGLPMGRSSVTHMSTRQGNESRAHVSGVAPPGALGALALPPPRVNDLPGVGPEGEGSAGLGDEASVDPPGGSHSARTPTPPGSVKHWGIPREAPKGFVAPGPDTPTEDWKQAFRDAVSDLLTPINQRLTFLEDGQKRSRKQRGRPQTRRPATRPQIIPRGKDRPNGVATDPVRWRVRFVLNRRDRWFPWGLSQGRLYLWTIVLKRSWTVTHMR